MKKSYKSISIICENLSELYKDGIDISMAVTLLEDVPLELPYKNSIKDIGLYVSKGETIHEAFSHYKKIYPEFFLGIIKLGENSGKIDKVLEALGKYYKKQYEIIKKVKDSLVYPIMILFLLIILMLALVFVILPIFYESLNNLGSEMPKRIKNIYLFQKYVKENIFISLTFLCSFIISIFIIFGILKSKINVFNILIKFKLIREVMEYIFILIMTVILESGMPLSYGLELCESSMELEIFKKELKRINKDIFNGKELNQSLKECKFISKYSLSMIKLGEDSGSMEERIEMLQRGLEKNVYRNIEKTLVFFQPAMLLVMALIITSFIGYFLLPLIDILYKVG
ncbi:MAG: type II secretion system F family protein [Clostridium sp.]|nr:type II secretion system F family protein [Clostridium sp.]